MAKRLWVRDLDDAHLGNTKSLDEGVREVRDGKNLGASLAEKATGLGRVTVNARELHLDGLGLSVLEATRALRDRGLGEAHAVRVFDHTGLLFGL